MKYLLVSTLFIALLTACGGEDKKEEAPKEDTTSKVQPRKAGDLTIAFYHSDSLANNFSYFKEMEAVMQEKETAFQNRLAGMQRDLESFSTTQQGKLEKGLLSDNEIQRVQATIQQKQEAIMQVQQVEGAKLQEESMKESQVLGNKIKAFAKDYCEANNIDILLQHAEIGQLTYISESFDVTEEFTAFVNQEQGKLTDDLSK